MSKTTQRKSAAFELGCKDGMGGLPIRKTVKRAVKQSYLSGYHAARSDRIRNARLAKGIPDPPREDWGPEPVQHEVPRPYRGY